MIFPFSDFEALLAYRVMNVNGCKDCVIYLTQNNLDSPVICEECGKQAVTWKLDKIGAPYVECSECGYKIAVDMNMPCELDSYFSENVTITIEPLKEALSKDVLLKLAKAFEMNAMQI